MGAMLAEPGFHERSTLQFAVLAGIMTIAVYLEATKKISPVLRILGCGAIVGAPWLLILVEPDLGMCIVWAPMVIALLFVGSSQEMAYRHAHRWRPWSLIVNLPSSHTSMPASPAS